MWGAGDDEGDLWASPQYDEEQEHDSDAIDSDIEEALLQQFHYAQTAPSEEDLLTPNLAVTKLTEEDAQRLKAGDWAVSSLSVRKVSKKKGKAVSEDIGHTAERELLSGQPSDEEKAAQAVSRKRTLSNESIAIEDAGDEESKYAISKRKSLLPPSFSDTRDVGPVKRRRNISTSSSDGSSEDDSVKQTPSTELPQCTDNMTLRFAPGSLSDDGEGLELPTVVLRTPSSTSSDDSDNEYKDEWHMDDDDPKGAAARYYIGGDAVVTESKNRYGPLCFQCGIRGHTKVVCPNAKDAICIKCGTKGHADRACPFEICFNCGQPGHQSRECSVRRRRWDPCNRCDIAGHGADTCPELWRQWLFTQKGATVVVSDDVNPLKYCYVCTGRGHYGHECSNTDLHWDRNFAPVSPFVTFYGDKHKFTKHFLNTSRKKPDKRHSDMHERGGHYDDLRSAERRRNGEDYARRSMLDHQSWRESGARSAPGSPFYSQHRHNDAGSRFNNRTPQTQDSGGNWSARGQESRTRHTMSQGTPPARQREASSKNSYGRGSDKGKRKPRDNATPPASNGPQYRGSYRR